MNLRAFLPFLLAPGTVDEHVVDNRVFLLGLDQLSGGAVRPEVGATVRDAIGTWDVETQRSVSGPPPRRRASSSRSGKPA